LRVVEVIDDRHELLREHLALHLRVT